MRLHQILVSSLGHILQGCTQVPNPFVVQSGISCGHQPNQLADFI